MTDGAIDTPNRNDGSAPSMPPVAIQISIQRSFTEGSGTQWITSVLQETPLEEINTITDKMMAAIERQELHVKISALHHEVEMSKKQRAQFIFNLEALKRRHGDFSKANVDTRTALSQSEEGLLRIDTLIDSLLSEQKRLREELE